MNAILDVTKKPIRNLTMNENKFWYLENVDLNPVGMPRGNATNNDWYFIGGVTISFNLTDKYGLDFDEKYDVFKEGFEPVEQTEKPDIF